MVTMPAIVSRSEWGALPPIRRHLISLPTPELYLHHSAGAGEDERTIRGIQNFHMAPVPVGRGWSDIAYSYLLDNDAPDVDIFEGRGAGVAGGHTKGRNTVSHGLCIIGNFTMVPPHPMTLDRTVDFAAAGAIAGWWRIGFTGGHRDAPNANTSCPGNALYQLIPTLNARIALKVEAYTLMDLPFPDLINQPTEVIEAVAWAKDNGLTMGTSAQTFSPNTEVTRGQLMVFLHRLSQLDG